MSYNVIIAKDECNEILRRLLYLGTLLEKCAGL